MADGKVVIDVLLDDGSVKKGVVDLNKQLGGLNQGGQKAALSIGKIAKAVGAVYLAKKAFDMVSSSIGAATKRIDTFEQFKRVMTAVTGSTSETNKALDRTNDIVTGTAYTLDGAAKSVQNFVTRGVSVDKATKYVEAFGDAVAFYGDGSQEQFDNVTDALSKMVTKGTVGMDQLDRLFDAGIDAVGMYAQATGQSADQVQKDLSNGKISAEDFIDTVSTAMMEGTNGVVKIKGAAKEAGATWGSTFANMKTAVARGVANIIESIDKMLTDNGLPDMRSMIASFGSKFESVLNALANNIPIFVNGLITGFNAVRSFLSPFVTWVIDAFKGLSENTSINFEQIKQFIITAFENVQAVVVPVVQAIVSFVMDIWGQLVAFWNENGQMILEAAQNVWSVIKAIITGAMTAIGAIMKVLWPIIKMLVIDTWNAIKNTIQGAIDVILGIVKFFSALFTGNWSAMWDATKQIFKGALQLVWGLINLWFVGKILKLGKVFAKGLQSIIKGLWNAIKSFFKGGVNAVKNITKSGFNFIKSLVNKVMNGIKSVISSIWNGIKSVFTGAVNAVKSKVSSGFNAVKSKVTSVMNGVKSVASSAWSSVKSKTSSLVTGMKNKVINTWTSLRSKTSSIFRSLKDKITSPLKSIKLGQIGKDIINGLIGGIKSKVEAVGNAVKSVTSKITGKLKSILGIHSPSRWMRDMIGKNMMLGWEKGINNGKNRMLNVTKKMGNWMKPEEPALGVGMKLKCMRGMAAVGSIMPSSVMASTVIREQVKQNNSNQSIRIEAGDVIMDGYKVGKVVWRPVKENIDRDDDTKKSFRG